jgi:hypothetical protein
MNTKPNDELLALWVDDELNAEAAAEVEAWASGQPEWLEKREQSRWSRRTLATALGAGEDVPYAEFFNARIRREIQQSTAAPQAGPGAGAAPRSKRRWAWALPATAAAGLAFGFFLGQEQEPPGDPLAGEWTPVLYTPEQGVEAEFVEADDATVIVLAGVEAISDDWEVPTTAMLPPPASRIAKHRDEAGESVQ